MLHNIPFFLTALLKKIVVFGFKVTQQQTQRVKAPDDGFFLNFTSLLLFPPPSVQSCVVIRPCF